MIRYFINIAILLSFIIIKTSYTEAQVIQCNLLAIRASNNGGGIDPSLNNYKVQLKRPPFSAFKSFRLIKKQILTLHLKRKVNFVTISGNVRGSLTFERIKGRFLNLRLVLFKGKKELLRTLVSVLKGKPFFIAGPSIRGGTLIMGIICK